MQILLRNDTVILNTLFLTMIYLSSVFIAKKSTCIHPNLTEYLKNYYVWSFTWRTSEQKNYTKRIFFNIHYAYLFTYYQIIAELHNISSTSIRLSNLHNYSTCHENFHMLHSSCSPHTITRLLNPANIYMKPNAVMYSHLIFQIFYIFKFK